MTGIQRLAKTFLITSMLSPLTASLLSSGIPLPSLSDYLGTHQCSKTRNKGGLEQSLNVCEFEKKGCLEFAEMRIRGGFPKQGKTQL